ncbi:MAG: hypothetical protein ACYYKD_11265 [Rhodospirillales bacterium]
MDIMNVTVTEQGELTLPPQALTVLNGAGFVTAERERAGGVLLKPAAADAAGAAPVTDAGALTLPPGALTIMRNWSDWDGRGVEVILPQNGGGLILYVQDAPEIQSIRKRFADAGITQADIDELIEEVRTEMYEQHKKRSEAAMPA